jgi:hypothetical protein
MSSYLQGRVDPIRSTFAGVAAVIALIAAFLDANDLWMSFQNIVVPFLLVAAAVAVVLAVWPASRPWSFRRRSIAAIAAIALAAVGIFVLPFGIAAAGCACTSATPPGWTPPEILGLQALAWIVIANAGVPLLLVLSALPSYIAAARQSHG